jgi:hypothetical protein
MKKSKLLILGLIALLLVGGLVLASCSPVCGKGCKLDKNYCGTLCAGSDRLFAFVACRDTCYW